MSEDRKKYVDMIVEGFTGLARMGEKIDSPSVFDLMEQRRRADAQKPIPELAKEVERYRGELRLALDEIEKQGKRVKVVQIVAREASQCLNEAIFVPVEGTEDEKKEKRQMLVQRAQRALVAARREDCF